MKKIRMLAGLALALAMAFQTSPISAESQKLAPALGADRSGVHQNLDFYGVTKPCKLNSSADVVCVTGEGFLDAVCPAGLPSAAYSVAIDCGNTNSTLANMEPYLLSPEVFSVNGTPANNCWVARNHAGGPVRFINGLVGFQNTDSGVTLLYYHLSNGANP